MGLFSGRFNRCGDYYEYDPNDDPNTPIIDCAENAQSAVDFTETVSISAEKVAEWINDPAANGGLLLRQKGSVDAQVSFISSDAAGVDIPKLTIDYTIIQVECGDIGTGALISDFSGPGGEPDCKVDKYDLAAFVSDWLKCSNPYDAGCDQ